MLSSFRALAKSPIAAVLIGLLVVSFAVFGTNDLFAGLSNTAVVKAGDREIGPNEFKRLFDNVRQQAERQSGRPIPVEEAVQQGLVERLLDDLASTESFTAMLSRIGIRPADSLIAQQLSRTPLFFNPVSGAFDRQAYQRQLAENGLTEEQFEGFLRDDLAQQHFVSGVVSGLRAPRIYGAVPAVFESETRSLTYFVVDPRIAGVPAPPADAQLNAFVKENADQLRRPETRNVSVVRFSASQLAPTLAVDEAEVRRQYDFRRESLSQPERRTVVQVPAPNQAAAQQVAQRLRAGEQAAAVARSIKVEPVRYDNVPRTAIVDRRAAETAFGLPAGGVSAPFQGDLGWAVVKVEAVTPAQVVSLDQARPQIEAQIRTEQAADRVLEQVQKFEDGIQGGQTLAEAARAIGVPVISLPPITARGTDANGNPTGAPQPLIDAAFEQAVGTESDVIEAGNNEFFVLRVDRINPAALPPLDEVRAPLTQTWILRQTVQRAQARANELAGQLRGANARPIEQVAASVNAQIGRAPQVERDAGGQTLSQDLVGKAFGAKAGDVIVGEHTQIGFVVARVDGAAVPPPAQLAVAANEARATMTQDVVQGLGDLARRHARTELKTRTWPDRARAALGLSPEAEAAAPASKQ